MTGFAYRDDQLHCEEIGLEEIARKVGTPAYVYSAGKLREAARRMRKAVGDEGDPLIAFAVKSNPNAGVLKVLAAEGLGADIVSIGEYRCARAAGIPAERIVFSGVGKTREEMAEALEGGVLLFNLESIEEAHDLSEVAAAMGKTAPVALRINPDVVAGTHEKISTGNADTKFGIPWTEAIGAFQTARDLPGLDPKGVTMHIGSQLTDLTPLRTAFERMGELIARLETEGFSIAIADLGGGLGVDYGPDQPDPPTPEAYGAMVREVTANWSQRLVFEPGRSISGEAGVLLSQVVRIKPGANHPWLILDAAMNDLMRPALYDAYHLVQAVRPSKEKMIVNIVGPVCETGDTFARRRQIDRVAAGDLVVFRTTGAYGAAMSNGYNSRPLAPEVLVDGDRWALVRQRIDLEQISKLPLPDWLG